MPDSPPLPVDVTLGAGALRGTQTDGINRFLGIPYAAAPVGERRFRAPVAPAAWSGVRDATAFGATAPQSPYGGPIGELLSCPVIEGDDILTANVWSPEDAAASPVVLWIHGGALERGAAAEPTYDGTAFARDGVVFVSVNYRLGVEGFSVLEGAPLNLGLLDVARALEWVHAEIGAFGGDPARITLMGESAGGALVAALLARPTSRALVAGAIIQSGPLEATSPQKARRASDAIARRLGIPPTRDAFAARTTADLLRARAQVAAGSSPLRGAPGFALAVDAETLPTSPEVALADLDLPILIGTNTDEYRLWLTPDALAEVGPAKAWLARRALRTPERAARAVRTALPDASAGEVLGQLLTERLLRAPATRIARARESPDLPLRVRLGEPGSGPARRPRAGARVRVRHAEHRPSREARRTRRAGGSRARHASRLGLVHHHGRPRLAGVRRRADDADLGCRAARGPAATGSRRRRTGVGRARSTHAASLNDRGMLDERHPSHRLNTRGGARRDSRGRVTHDARVTAGGLVRRRRGSSRRLTGGGRISIRPSVCWGGKMPTALLRSSVLGITR